MPNREPRDAFWQQFGELTKGRHGEDWRLESLPGPLEAAFERELSTALGEQFSRRFLGRGPGRHFPGDPGEQAPESFYTRVKKVGFRCRVTGYSSVNLEMTISGFQSLAEIFDRDFESFRVFFEPFLYGSLASAYNSRLASNLAAELSFPDAFRLDFERSLPPAAPDTRRSSDAWARADWLWRLANGSLLVPVLLALAVLVFGGLALRDLHRSYIDGISRLLERAVPQAVSTPPAATSAPVSTATSAAPSSGASTSPAPPPGSATP